MDLNMLLYVILFFIMLGLFLASLAKSRKSRGSMEDAAVADRRQVDPKREPEDEGK